MLISPIKLNIADQLLPNILKLQGTFMKRFHYLFIGLLFILTTVAHENETIKKIEDAFQSGQINYEQALLQKFYSGFNQSKLDDKFFTTSSSPQKCATHLIAEFRNNLDKLSNETVDIITEMITPAVRKKNNSVTAETYISPYGKFELTYSTSGTHRVPAEDLDNNGIPDYVEFVANYFDHSWKVLIDTLGFKPIPLNPGEYYQISFEDMPYYGYTTWTNTSAGTEIVMHNNYNGFPPNSDPDGNVLGAAKVTAVHEFKHAIQFIYNNWGEPGWFIEADATWSEDIGFDQTNDYYNYLGSSQITSPGRGLAQGDGYEDNLYFHFFTEKYGDDTNREIWERREQFNESVYSSVGNMLQNYGAFFDEAFLEYYTWLYNTGNRYNPNLPGFGEAESYPNPSLCSNILSLPAENSGCTRGALSGSFIVYNSQNQNQYLQLLMDTPSGNNQLAVIKIYTDQTAETEFYELNNNTQFDLFVQPKLSEIDQLIIIPVVTSTTGSSFAYSYSLDAFQTAVIQHTPFLDTENSGDIEFIVNLETPQNLAYVDSLKVFYQINNIGFESMQLLPTGNLNEYSAILLNPGDDVQIDYYFRIADQLDQKVHLPESAPDSTFSFYIGADNQFPQIVHNSLNGTPKYNFPLYVYANVSDNIGLDSVYIEYRLNEDEWVKEEMISLGNNYYVSLLQFVPDDLSTGDLVDYKITAVDNSSNNNKTILPENNFFRIDVTNGFYYSNKPNIEIREHILASTNDTLSITDEINIEDINVYFKSDHPKFSDLHIRLYDPLGNEYDLVNRDWFETENENAGSPSIIFDQEAYFNFGETLLIDLDSAKGSFAPVDADLTQLYGTSTLGDWRLRVYDKGMNSIVGNWLEWGLIIKGEGTTNVEDENEILVKEYQLYQNYPNPFNPSTQIKFAIPQAGIVTVKVYDIIGREVTTVVNDNLNSGTHEVVFNANNLSSGIYFVRMASQNFTSTKKIMLIK
ncbi:MAG: T9SS C-terminal target domain-containing protein [Ignavibacteriales bacterium]|nr:MAG: T9SS C-terminal target domain-containing protein [Ignavibacteriales bacterium]